MNQYIHSLSNVRIITKFYSSIIGWRKLKVGWNTSINNIPLAGYTCRWRNKQHQWRYWFLHRRKIFIHKTWFQYFSISWTLYISLSINSCLKIYFITWVTKFYLSKQKDNGSLNLNMQWKILDWDRRYHQQLNHWRRVTPN